jgi:hypothetical protein
MTMTDISLVEISEASARLGLVAGTVTTADVASVCSRGLSDVLQTMGSKHFRLVVED